MSALAQQVVTSTHATFDFALVALRSNHSRCLAKAPWSRTAQVAAFASPSSEAAKRSLKLHRSRGEAALDEETQTTSTTARLPSVDLLVRRWRPSRPTASLCAWPGLARVWLTRWWRPSTRSAAPMLTTLHPMARAELMARLWFSTCPAVYSGLN